MKLINVTTQREKMRGTVAFAYQFYFRNGIYLYYKILKISCRYTQQGAKKKWTYSIHARYFQMCNKKDHAPHNDESLSTFYGIYDSYYGAMKRVKGLIETRGNGDFKRWQKFQERRTKIKRK